MLRRNGLNRGVQSYKRSVGRGVVAFHPTLWLNARKRGCYMTAPARVSGSISINGTRFVSVMEFPASTKTRRGSSERTCRVAALQKWLRARPDRPRPAVSAHHKRGKKVGSDRHNDKHVARLVKPKSGSWRRWFSRSPWPTSKKENA